MTGSAEPSPQPPTVIWWRLLVHLVISGAAALITWWGLRIVFPALDSAALTGRRSVRALLLIVLTIGASRLLDHVWPLVRRNRL